MTKKSAGRKPVDIVRAGGKADGRQQIWDAIRQLKTFATIDVENETRIKETTIRTYLQGLENAGFIEKTGDRKVGCYPRSFKAVIWSLVKDVGIDAPRVTRNGTIVTQGTAQQNMWRTMKITGEFNYIELATLAGTDKHPIRPSAARDYIKHLYRVGYLMMTQKETKGNRATTPARYRFVKARNTGGKAPMVQRIKQVFDPNLGEVVAPVERAP